MRQLSHWLGHPNTKWRHRTVCRRACRHVYKHVCRLVCAGIRVRMHMCAHAYVCAGIRVRMHRFRSADTREDMSVGMKKKANIWIRRCRKAVLAEIDPHELRWLIGIMYRENLVDTPDYPVLQYSYRLCSYVVMTANAYVRVRSTVQRCACNGVHLRVCLRAFRAHSCARP